MKQLLSILFLLFVFSSSSRAERMPSAIHEFIAPSELIVSAKVTANVSNYFQIKVVEVFHGTKTGIQKGDYIKIRNNFREVTSIDPVIFVPENAEKGIFFMKHSSNGWEVNYGKIAYFINGVAELPFYREGCTMKLTEAEWKLQFESYFKEFSLNEDGQLTGRLTETEVNERMFPDLTLLQYAQLYPELIKDGSECEKCIWDNLIVEPSIEEQPEMEAKEETIQVVAATPPMNKEETSKLLKKLHHVVHEQLPELRESEAVGRVYFSLLFEKDGSISEVKILRSYFPKVDPIIRAYFKEHNAYKPPLNDFGQPVRFRLNLPLKI